MSGNGVEFGHYPMLAFDFEFLVVVGRMFLKRKICLLQCVRDDGLSLKMNSGE